MASKIWEFFGFSADDNSSKSLGYRKDQRCPFTEELCEKKFRDGTRTGVCSLKPMKGDPVICCPIRLYADDYVILKDVVKRAFGANLPLKRGRDSVDYSLNNGESCVAVFGKRWGGELRLPQKEGKGAYFVDWVLAHINAYGEVEEFVAVEVQTIDTTGSYGNGFTKLLNENEIIKTTAGFNWENVSKRILPQLIYKGQVLQREDLCRKGLFFVCPTPVYERIMSRLGGKNGLLKYQLQPAAITFLSYSHSKDIHPEHGKTNKLMIDTEHTTTVYKVQEAFNNVTLPDANVFQDAILRAITK
ncbi:NotI family restriction endonuclease [Erwinia sp. B116]|uniref:NotI family restriction endonuclease n=1 Tax=Erwinia sp. B116 TaxID=1561024 RepID=UPI000C75E23C|nr:NotI family restriction endonuclease [Erwinia sp. B116]